MPVIGAGRRAAADTPPQALLDLREKARRMGQPIMVMDPLTWGRERAEGFWALYDGRTLDGWVPVHGTPGQWMASNGILRYEGGASSWLRTATTYDDFVLRLQWRHLKAGGDGGVFLRASRDGTPWPAAHQVRMHDAPDAGSLLKGGLNVPAHAGARKPSPAWNDMEIQADGPKIVVKLNGTVVSQTSAAPLKVGFLGLEGEGTPFEVRNLRIREIGWTPLYNGLNLAGWIVRSPGHWTPMAGGVLAYDGKDGDLNTLAIFRDYDLRLDWRIDSPKSDSGVYYRGSGFDKGQANIWNDPLGSGEDYGYRTDTNQPEAVRKAATPTKRADNPVGQWNHFDIRVRGRTVDVWLNGEHVIQGATFPGMPLQGPIALQNHGDPVWFRHIDIRRVGVRSPATPMTPRAIQKATPAGNRGTGTNR